MGKFFLDKIYSFNEYELNQDEDIFEKILEERKNESDSKRFFLNYVSSDDLLRYDFSRQDSLKDFRKICLTCHNPILEMGGCNLKKENLSRGLIYGGIKLSDPFGRIPGQFDIRDHVITYSPIFPLFYKQRDLCKFANDAYFTTMTFEEIIMNQINNGVEYYVHTRNFRSLQELTQYGAHILEKISKEQMIEFIIDHEKGKEILKRYRGL